MSINNNIGDKMTLELDRRIYRPYSGSLIYVMPNIIKRLDESGSYDLQKRTLAAVYDFIVARLNDTFPDIQEARRNNYFITGDAVAQREDGRFKIVLDSQDLMNVNRCTDMIDGGLPLTEDKYRNLPGNEYTAEQREKYTGINFSSVKAVLANPIWRYEFARGDKHLLNEYAKLVYATSGEKENMDIEFKVGLNFIDPENSLRPWNMGRLGVGGRSIMSCSDITRDGYMMGVADEALPVLRKGIPKSLEERANK